MYYRPMNTLQFHWCTFIVLWLPTCFGHSCGTLQGDFFETKKKIVITMCLNHSTVLQLELKLKKHICYITSNNPQLTHTIHILQNVHKYGPTETAITLLHPPPPFSKKKKKKWTPRKITIFSSFTNTSLLRNKHKKKIAYLN